ncbi:MAG TPA: VTT domain-containing protein [Anaerolineales bacterium]|nr:VTT domain-containing protein [Anaerolineales bacterium]
MKKLILIFLLTISLITLFGFREGIFKVFSWFGSLDAVTASMERAGIWGPIALFILFVLQVFLAFIPGQALMIACGYLYGFWGGFLISWLSLVLGGEIAYLLARNYGRPFAEKWITPSVLERWNKSAEGQGIAFFAVSLVMPLVPNDAMCYVAGLGTIRRIHFSIANMLGRGMACLITSAAGAFGGSISWQGWAILIAIFVIIGIAWHIAKYYRSHLLIA